MAVPLVAEAVVAEWLRPLSHQVAAALLAAALVAAALVAAALEAEPLVAEPLLAEPFMLVFRIGKPSHDAAS